MKKLILIVGLGLFGIMFFARAQSLTELAGDGWIGKDVCQKDQDCALVTCFGCCGPMSLNVKYADEWYSTGEDKKLQGIIWECAEPDTQEYHYEAKCLQNLCQKVSVSNDWLWKLKSKLNLIYGDWFGYLLSTVILAIIIYVILKVRTRSK